MKLYDVAWSTSEKKWVVRSTHLRWVGDTIAARDSSEEGAHHVVAVFNSMGFGEHLSNEDLRKAGLVQ